MRSGNAHLRLLSIAIVVAAGNLFLDLGSPVAEPAEVRKAPNPHWTREGCGACHDLSSGKVAPIALEKTDGVCLSCHDGKRAAAEVHPVHREFARAEGIIQPKAWPAVDGRVGCVTCHEARFGCDLEAHARADNPSLLRQGGRGPQRGELFCQNCHTEQAYPKIDPHAMLSTTGEVLTGRCTVCHEKALDWKTGQRSGHPQLQAEEAVICRDCHGPHNDATTQMHVGLKIKPKMLGYIRAMEVLGPSARPTRREIEQFSKEPPRFVVPAGDGSMTCSTCHNPHERGVFPAQSVLAAGAMQVGSQGKPVSPVHEANWCRRCHAN